MARHLYRFLGHPPTKTSISDRDENGFFLVGGAQEEWAKGEVRDVPEHLLQYFEHNPVFEAVKESAGKAEADAKAAVKTVKARVAGKAGKATLKVNPAAETPAPLVNPPADAGQQGA